MSASFDGPVFDLQSIDSRKLVRVIRHENQIAAQSVSCNQCVHRADRRSGALQLGLDLTEYTAVGFVERQHFERLHEVINSLVLSTGSVALLGTVSQFRRRDHRQHDSVIRVG